MIYAFDAAYDEDKRTAVVAGICFKDWKSEEVEQSITLVLENVEPYVPGELYKRELPLIESVINVGIAAGWEPPKTFVVDGYVDLDHGNPGLGRRLFELYNGKVPVVGIAKTPYRSAEDIEVVRNGSKRPLYVTAAGVPDTVAGFNVLEMYGKYRFPTLLQQLDWLTRNPGKTLDEKGVTASLKD